MKPRLKRLSAFQFYPDAVWFTKFRSNVPMIYRPGYTRTRFCFRILGDFLVTSPNHKTHRKHLQFVFKKIAEYGIIIGPEKCHFGTTELSFLWHYVSSEGISPTYRCGHDSKFHLTGEKGSVVQILGHGELLPSIYSLLCGEIDTFEQFTDGSQ